LRSFTGNVIEEGTTEHISGFEASLIGLGPRQGYRHDTVEGKHPDPAVVGSHFGAFVIPGPIYSGHYELQITTVCYLPIRSDSWWNFCLEESSYTPQIFNFNLKPTPEFEQSRNQVRSLLKKMNEERDKATQAADIIANARRKAQTLSDLATGLSRDLNALKQQYPGLEKLCTDTVADLKSIESDSAALEAAGKEIMLLRETAKYMAGMACELSQKAQSQPDPAKASNLAISGINRALLTAGQVLAQVIPNWPTCNFNDSAIALAEDGGPIDVEEIPEDGENPVEQKKGPVTGSQWILESVTQSPVTPPQGWSYSSGSASLQIYNGDRASFTWTPPPQQIDSNGFTVSMSAQGNPAAPNGRLAALIGVSTLKRFLLHDKNEGRSIHHEHDFALR